MQPATPGKPASFLTHVNGLRALAILGIVVYHLNATYCPAGYFGVDIFLVISGYFLLASLMKAERAGDIHYGSFLLKKSWRIIPSWFVVSLVFCFASAWFMIPPDRVEIFSTAFRSAYFGADFFIDHLYDYFNQKAHQNLFLHYWYLSITCQMYVVVPLILMLLLRFVSKKAAVVALAVLALLSLAIYVLTSSMQVPEDIRNAVLAGTGMKTTYYHLLPRLWEVLAGGLVLLLPAWQEKRWLRILLESIAAFGMVFSFFWFETGSAQVYAAAICAILFIRYGGEGYVSRLLAWRPFQWVGTISFSLYLWHWPIMAAWKYVKLGEIAWYDELGMLLCSFLLAALAWRVVENLRMPKGASRLMLCARALPLLLIVLFICGVRPWYKHIRMTGYDGLLGQGLTRELYEHMATLPPAEGVQEGFPTKEFSSRPVYIGSNENAVPSFVLMGDSHALHSYHGMNKYCSEHGIRGVALNINVIPFWWCYVQSAWSESKAEGVMEYLRQHEEFRYVFITMLWESRLCGGAKDNGVPTLDWRGMKTLDDAAQIALREEGLAETCRRLTAMGKRVVLLADVPILPPNLSPFQLSQKMKMLRGVDAPEYLTPVSVHQQAAARYTTLFRRLKEEGKVWAVIDCAEPLRQGENYRTRNDKGQFLYSDNNHLTYAGSEHVLSYVLDEWQRLVQESNLINNE